MNRSALYAKAVRLALLFCVCAASSFAQLSINIFTDSNGLWEVPYAQKLTSVNSVENFQGVSASGGVAPYTWSLSGSLTSVNVGVATSTTDFQNALTGTVPASAIGQQFTYNFTVTDSQGNTANASGAAIVLFDFAPISSGAVSGTVGQSITESGLIAFGGAGPFRVLAVPGSGQLPPGLALSSAWDGATDQSAFAGVFDAPGTFTFSLQLQDPTGVISSPSSVTVTVAPVFIGPASGASPSIPYDLGQMPLNEAPPNQITAGSGVGPFIWTLTSGSLPPGIALLHQTQNPTDGALAGTPTTVGNYAFTVQMTDSFGNVAQQAFTAEVPPYAVQATALPGALVGQPYEVQRQPNTPLPAIVGGAQNVFDTSASGLPPGMRVDPSYGLVGTPSAPGTYSFQISYHDNASPALRNSQSFVLSVANFTTYPAQNSATSPFTNPGADWSYFPYNLSVGPGNLLYVTEDNIDDSSQYQARLGGLSTQGAFSGPFTTPPIGVGCDAAFGPSANCPGVIAAVTDAHGGAGLIYSTDNGPSYTTTENNATGLIDVPSAVQIALNLGSAPSVSYSAPVSRGNAVWMAISANYTDNSGNLLFYAALVEMDFQHVDGNGAPVPHIYALPDANSSISTRLAVSTDNEIWFLDVPSDQSGENFLARFNPDAQKPGSPAVLDTPSGCPGYNAALIACAIDQFGGFPSSLPTPISVAGIVAGQGTDSSIWLNLGSGYLARMPLDASSLSLITLPASLNGTIDAITGGNDGALWFEVTPVAAGLIVRLTPAGAITIFSPYYGVQTSSGSWPTGTPASFTSPSYGLISGPDNAMWFTTQGVPFNGVNRIAPPLTFNCSNSLTYESGQTISLACPVLGAVGSVTYTGNSLPTGFSVSSAGLITGVAGAAGNYTFSVTATDSQGNSATQQFNLTVTARPPVTLTCDFSKPAQVGVPYSATCTGGGGLPPVTYAVTSGTNLPSGLALNTATGIVSGTPGPLTFGLQTISVTASDSGTPALTATSVSQLAILAAPLTINCGTLPQAEVNVPYLGSCLALGGTGNYTFTNTTGTLPAGLTLNTNGTVTGTPTAAGVSTFTVQVTDPGPAGLSDAQTATTPAAAIDVLPARLGLQCDFTAIPKVGSAYTTSCSVLNETATTHTFTIAGNAPHGLAVDATGHLTFTPTAPGPFSFTISTTDNGQTAYQVVSLNVQPVALTITSSTLPNAFVGLPYSGNLLAAGGHAPYTWSVLDASKLPPGITLTQDASTSAWILSGTAATGTQGSYTFTLQAKDGASTPVVVTQSFTVTVAGAQEGNFTEYAIGATSGVDSLTTTPDGSIWFTTVDQSGGNLVGRIGADGTVATYPAPNPLGNPNTPAGAGLTVGPDLDPAAGANFPILWLVEPDSNRIGQVSTQINSSTTPPFPNLRLDFPIAASNSGPRAIVNAPNGALWFTETNANSIVEINTIGAFPVGYAAPTTNSGLAGLAVGPDNALWFTETNNNKIGRLTTAGSFTNFYAVPTSKAAPTSIVTGPDGALWFVESAASKIGRISLAGAISEWPISSPASQILTGADGALYFLLPATASTEAQLGRITVNGTVTYYQPTGGLSSPTGIALGADGSIWIGENGSSKLARFQFASAVQVACTYQTGSPRANTAYSGACTASGGVAPYKYALSGTPPPGVVVDSSTGALSGTLQQAGIYTFAVQATDSADPANAATAASDTVTVEPGALTLDCSSLPAGAVGQSYSGACKASLGTPPYTYSVSSGLPVGLTIDPASGTISGTPTGAGTFPFTVQVADSGAGANAQAATTPASITVTLGSGTLFTITGIPDTANPGTTLSGGTVQLAQALTSPISGTLKLAFAFNTFVNAVSGNGAYTDPLPNNYVDPAMQFIDSNGNALGTSFNFTIPAGATSFAIPNINVGSVEGTVQVEILASNSVQTAQGVLIPQALVIEPGSVQITNLTSTGFDVELIGYSSDRYLEFANFAFTPANGAQLQGETNFTIDLRQVMLNWFDPNVSSQYGGAFSLTVPFTLSGPSNGIGSVAVTLFSDGGQGNLNGPGVIKSNTVTGTP